MTSLSAFSFAAAFALVLLLELARDRRRIGPATLLSPPAQPGANAGCRTASPFFAIGNSWRKRHLRYEKAALPSPQ
jgi:hypothetical protein